jgi:hypothetical protein
MRISETTSYPHPVLAPWSGDIDGATFSTTTRFREVKETGQLSLHCETTLDQPQILELMNSGAASFGCYIRCQDTGLRRLQRIGYPIGTHDFAPGALMGRVQIRPMIWTNSEVLGYQPTGVHPEFSGGVHVGAGQIIALDEEQIIDVTRPPLPPFESIFEIVASDDVSDGEFEIDTESDRITVAMAPTTYEVVQALRQTDDASRAAVMNAVYIPIVMEVLDRLKDGIEQYEQYRWLHPFRSRCELSEVDLLKPDLLNDAHKVLAKPFAMLRLLIEEEEDERDG